MHRRHARTTCALFGYRTPTKWAVRRIGLLRSTPAATMRSIAHAEIRSPSARRARSRRAPLGLPGGGPRPLDREDAGDARHHPRRGVGRPAGDRQPRLLRPAREPRAAAPQAGDDRPLRAAVPQRRPRRPEASTAASRCSRTSSPTRPSARLWSRSRKRPASTWSRQRCSTSSASMKPGSMSRSTTERRFARRCCCWPAGCPRRSRSGWGCRNRGEPRSSTATATSSSPARSGATSAAGRSCRCRST